MNTTQRLTGLTLAMLLTVAMLGGIDRLAHDEFAAVSAQTPTRTLAQTPASTPDPADAARV